MSYALGTKTPETCDGCTAITSASLSMKGLSYDRSTANKMLDQVREGQSCPLTILNLCLIATGDMKGEHTT